MDAKNFIELLKSRHREFGELVQRNLPVIAGRMAKDHFQDNFRRGGFVDNSLEPWKPAKRLSSPDSGAASKYGTLLSGRNHLFSSIRYTPGAGRVIISASAKYAAIHNEGGETHPTVTPKMRAFAWRQFYKASGIRRNSSQKTRKKKLEIARDNPQAEFWKRLALTKKTRLTIRIPKRQFIGESRLLSRKITDKINEQIKKLLDS